MDCNCNVIKFILEDNTQDIIVNIGDNPLPGADDYNNLKNKPQINNVLLQGNKTLADLGIVNDKTYTHVQSTASNEWRINHNLNKYPSVTVIDSAENEVVGETHYVDNNNIIITFRGSFSGKAVLN